MGFLTENWFFILIALGCIGMHLFGHGHGLGGRDHHASTRDDGAPGGNVGP